MSQIALQEFRQSEPPTPSRTLSSRFRTFCCAFWLDYFFFFAHYFPAYCTWTKNFHLWFVARLAHGLRTNVQRNAKRILGPDLPPDQQTRFARDVAGNFFDFVYDVGRTRRMSRKQILTLVDSIEGHDRYAAVRALGKGAIVVTAHMGSFEAGLAALLEHESQPIHVVFKRDLRGRFEQIRSSLRTRLGVHEAAIDDGWTIWMRLRDALQSNHVVNLQADRVMPGQKGQPVPFCHGHLLLPTGPIKLAIASGAPLVPVFSIRTPEGKIKIHIEPPIWVDPTNTNDPHPALLQLASVLERYVKSHPTQWLLLHPAFLEDAPPTEVRP